MCWSTTVSAASALVGWGACAYLWNRNHSPRDQWYARYLLTFTFSQLVDIALWTLHEDPSLGPLQACKGFQLQSWSVPQEQRTNFLISKIVLPLVVLSQHAAQCTFPSDQHNGPGQRNKLILLHLIPVGVMSFAFGCTALSEAKFPVPHETLHWGGDFSDWPWLLIQIGACLHSGIVAVVFWLVCPQRVALMHTVVLGCVIGTLAVTEGTIELGSKWCTYCLIFSVVYTLEPWWNPEQESKGIKAE
eukprot:TRINITY_DN35042_c0_g1_i1.p1 TRINITY_DN35042_c0_g1~~TRINITY_DN35042_c0_g1_i1.p1  ORF type:complete len:246 (-),score=35.94 TRINITY_DN35042_c0_g1_i1:26-763(-)